MILHAHIGRICKEEMGDGDRGPCVCGLGAQ
jgi:hypothetical protein